MTKIWAHRGASGYAPENTVEAFRLALEMGADGVELDVQMTRDKELVVIHDEAIDRTSDGSGAVGAYTLAELKHFNFGYRQKEGALAAEIPTLAEVLALLRMSGLVVNVEFKTGIVDYPGIEEKTLGLVYDFGMSDRIIYSSFNHYSVMRVKELDPTAKTGLLFGEGHLFAAKAAAALGADAIHPDIGAFNHIGFFEDCKARGLLVHTWTVNDESDMRRVIDLGVDALITNYPDRARRLLKD